MLTDPLEPAPSDQSGTEPSPTRILPMLSSTGNQRVLVSWHSNETSARLISWITDATPSGAAVRVELRKEPTTGVN